MREIKFRAWDCRPKVREYSLPFELGEDPHWPYKGLGDQSDFLRPEIVIEQFTGLHDKNGKEIYEGDLVEDVIGISEVIYWKGAFGFSRGAMKTPFCINDMNGYKVIGNIHENPELLT